MEFFKISNGPWQKLFDGDFQKNEVLVYSNDNSVLFVMIPEKQGQKTVGAVVELYKVFFAKGELESYVESLPREIILLAKHSEKETLKFLLLGSNPTYIEWNEEQFIEETDRLLKKIETSSKILSDVAHAYDIQLQEIHSTTSPVRKAFFSMPLMVPIISSNYRAEEMLAQEVPVSFHEFNVGITKQKQKIVEPITVFSKTIVVGGQKHERNHAVQLVAEGFLLSGAPVIIFDFESQFLGLKQPAQNIEELKSYLIEAEPIGFPVRSFLPLSELKIDLNLIDPFGFAECMGFGKSKAVEVIATTLMENKIKDLNGLVEKIKSLPQDKFSEYETARAVRILSLLEKINPGLFDGTNPVEELTTRKVKALGRGSILDLNSVDERIRMLLVHNILFSILEYFKGKEKGKGIMFLIVIPEAKNVFSEKISPAISKDIAGLIAQLESFGIGYIFSGESEMDFPQETMQGAEAQISIIQERDCAVSLKGRKSYRVILRPTLSAAMFSQKPAQAQSMRI